jgi:ribosomal protein S18 acetylase RimI-like enzyme
MTGDELTARWATNVDDYALDLHRSRGLPLDQARAAAERQTTELLPDGVATDGVLLFMAEIERATIEGVTVGWIWISLPTAPERPDTAWIFNVEIDAEHRGKGYGRAIMLAAEDELARRGIPRLALNVFGYNTAARRLYESLGFEVTSQQMVKALAPPDR